MLRLEVTRSHAPNEYYSVYETIYTIKCEKCGLPSRYYNNPGLYCTICHERLPPLCALMHSHYTRMEFHEKEGV